MENQARQAVILGARSLVSPYLMARLAASGWAGVCISRQAQPADLALPVGFEWRTGDDFDAPAGAVVFSCLPIWILRKFLSRVPRGGRLVALGSTSVVTKQASASAAERKVALLLQLGEQAVTSGHARWTILRPTMIYDSVADGNVARLMQTIRRWGFLPLPYPATGLRQPVHADDVAAFLLAAAEHADCAGQVLTVTGGETLTYCDMVRRIFACLGKRPVLLMLPGWLLKLAAWLTGHSGAMIDRINEDLAFEGESAVRMLGVTPRGFLYKGDEGVTRADGETHER